MNHMLYSTRQYKHNYIIYITIILLNKINNSDVYTKHNTKYRFDLCFFLHIVDCKCSIGNI